MSSSDVKLFYAINGLAGRSHFWDQVFIFASKYAIAIFGIILAIYFFKNRRIFWTGLASVIFSRVFFTEIIRYLYSRPRPFLNLQNVRQLIEKNGAEPSFPSGHAAILFSIAFVVYLYHKKIGVILIAVALLMTFARIYTGVHYPSDILGGIVTAGLSVYLVRKFETKLKKQR